MGKNAFELFGISAEFFIDQSDLESRYRNLSKQVHPDKFSDAGKSERHLALSHAVSVNEAYRTLKDPLKRAEALLEIYGGAHADNSASADFLMDMMQLRESLSEVRQQRDMEKLAQLRADVEARERDTVALLSTYFAQGRVLGAAELGQAAALCSELKYYRRFFEEALAIEDAWTC